MKNNKKINQSKKIIKKSKKISNSKTKIVKSKALVVSNPKEKKVSLMTMSQVQLSPSQLVAIQAKTPKEFIKQRKGRGGKFFSYVEGGYTTAKLNQIFGCLNWEFEILERGETQRKTENNTEGEVWVFGKLSIIDHKTGNRVGKSQFGGHPIHSGVPIGDAYKAASTDCLKKCAALYGISLDIYWGMLDSEPKNNQTPPPTPPQNSKKIISKGEAMRMTLDAIKSQGDPTILGEMKFRIQRADSKVFTDEQKLELITKIDAKIGL